MSHFDLMGKIKRRKEKRKKKAEIPSIEFFFIIINFIPFTNR